MLFAHGLDLDAISIDLSQRFWRYTKNELRSRLSKVRALQRDTHTYTAEHITMLHSQVITKIMAAA